MRRSGEPSGSVLSRGDSPSSKRKAGVAAAAVLAEDTEGAARMVKVKRPKLTLRKYSASDKEALSGKPSSLSALLPNASLYPRLSPPLAPIQSTQKFLPQRYVMGV